MSSRYCFTLLAILTLNSAAAQGLKFDESVKAERFTDGKDKQVGLTVYDSLQKITWMRCLVNQEFDSAAKVCAGDGKATTYAAAVSFAGSVGKGWRLPSYWEVKGASDYVMRIMAKGATEPAGKYGGGGWACERQRVWTTTGHDGNPNLVTLATCTGFTRGNDIENRPTEKSGGDTALIILVKG